MRQILTLTVQKCNHLEKTAVDGKLCNEIRAVFM